MSKAELKVVPIKDISVSKTNPRKTFDEKAMKELKESILQHGILQPILIRPKGKKYELVCGERRFRASKEASLTDIPVNIRTLSDDEAFELQIVENLERKDVHPLEEAEAFKRMLDSGRYSVQDIAAKVAKNETFVAQRLKFVDLIDEIKVHFRGGFLGIGHAILLARLQPERQMEIYNDSKSGWHRNEDNPEYGTVAELKDEIDDEIFNLEDAPFPLISKDLVKAAGPCSTCVKRTGTNPILFADMQTQDSCMDSKCYESKVEAFTEKEVAKIINDGIDVPFAMDYSGSMTDTIKSILKQYGITPLRNYDDWNSHERSNWSKKKVFNVSDGTYQEVYLKPAKKKTSSGKSDEASLIKEEIQKIEERAKRSLELDNVKVFKAIKEDPKLYEEYPLSNDPLTELEEKALWYIFRREALDWGSIRNYKKTVNAPEAYGGLSDFEFYKNTSLEKLNLNMLVRMAIKDKLTHMHEPDFGNNSESRFYFEIIKEQMPSSVKALVDAQSEIATKRIARSNDRIAKLKEKIEPKAEKPKGLKWEKVEKKYALKNSYFKFRKQNYPSNPLEISQYVEEHAEPPFDMGQDNTDWLYESYVEYQKKNGVHHSQFFTPPKTAQKIFDILWREFITSKSDTVLDLCCGFGQLSAPFVQEEFDSVTGIDFSQDLVDMFNLRFSENAKAERQELEEYKGSFDIIVANPPYEIPKFTKFLEKLDELLLDTGYAALLIPKNNIEKERPKALVEAISKFNVEYREDMQEDFARTKIQGEIVILSKKS